MRILALAFIAALAAPAAAGAEFSIDMTELRRLADEMPGAKPAEIRVETLGHFVAPWSMVIEGGDAATVEMDLLAYQLIFGDKTLLIDTALGEALVPQFGIEGWDSAASTRLDTAMAKADTIIVTHEHFDHIGRIVAQAGDAGLMARTRLTAEQVARPQDMEGVKWPEGALATYTPLAYERVHALAPGVVLLKAPGHTPGSQLVFVKTAGGAEYLFLGDVAWQQRNVAEMTNRSAETVASMKEDNAAVTAQLEAIYALGETEPDLAIIPGHDGAVIEALVTEGKLIAGFAD